MKGVVSIPVIALGSLIYACNEPATKENGPVTVVKGDSNIIACPSGRAALDQTGAGKKQ